MTSPRLALPLSPIPLSGLPCSSSIRTLTISRLGWIADYPIMDNFLYPLFHSDSLGGDNRSGYNNPEFDAKVDEARTIVDDEERVAKMQEADAMVAADCPVIPIMFYTHTIAGSDRIKHLYVDPQKHADLGTAELA